jgi:hypothetical protein
MDSGLISARKLSYPSTPLLEPLSFNLTGREDKFQGFICATSISVAVG